MYEDFLGRSVERDSRFWRQSLEAKFPQKFDDSSANVNINLVQVPPKDGPLASRVTQPPLPALLLQTAIFLSAEHVQNISHFSSFKLLL